MKSYELYVRLHTHWNSWEEFVLDTNMSLMDCVRAFLHYGPEVSAGCRAVRDYGFALLGA